jgi:hypothetical protein
VRGGGCSQPGLLSQEGHQVAKLEHAIASSKLQHSTLYSMHSLFQDWNISFYKPLEYAFE